MNVSTTIKSKWPAKFIVLDGAYFKLFNQALKNLELNKIEDRTTTQMIVTSLENRKAG